jgi:hypothetical protein
MDHAEFMDWWESYDGQPICLTDKDMDLCRWIRRQRFEVGPKFHQFYRDQRCLELMDEAEEIRRESEITERIDKAKMARNKRPSNRAPQPVVEPSSQTSTSPVDCSSDGDFEDWFNQNFEFRRDEPREQPTMPSSAGNYKDQRKNESSPSRPRRDKRRPGWMTDYV